MGGGGEEYREGMLLYCIYYLTKEIKECAMSYTIDEYQNWRVTRGLGRGEEER